MPPSNIAITNEVKVVVSSANSSYSTFTIDSTTTSASTDITTIATVGKSTVQELYSFPNYPQASSVDFYMRFSVNKVLPEGSVLRILPPDSVEFLTGPMANDKVFFSKLYSHV